MYRAYVRESLLDFRRRSAGALTNMICTQSVRLVDGVVRPLLVVVTEAILLAAVVGLVWFVSPGLIAVVVLACGLAGGLYYAHLRHKALQWGKRRMEAASTLHELVGNTATGIREIKIFGKEDYIASRVYAAAAIETDMFRNLEMYQQGPRFLVESVFMVAFVAVYSISLLLGADPSVLLAKFSVVAAASFRILPSINRLVNSYSSFSFNSGPAFTLLETLEDAKLPARGEPAARPVQRDHFSGSTIELRDVSFGYPAADTPVLDGVNMTIRKGERVGVVGVSGSGKSTLLEIFAGLYGADGGHVIVDGRSILVDTPAWQESIGYVPQTSFIMPGTIRENVAFGADGGGRDDEVWNVLARVGLTKFVSSLPLGIETPIGEKGLGLSGGQGQLISLARALFRNPAVLLLDEPTASLDSRSEQVVLDAIKSLASTTIVMASHKLENFHGFDRLYVCERGALRALDFPHQKVAVF